VIAPTPISLGTSVSIPFDTSSLGWAAVVQCYLDGEYYGECASPFTASEVAGGTHTLQVSAGWGGVSPADSYGTVATRAFTVG
jgi:hypothetical protein